MQLQVKKYWDLKHFEDLYRILVQDYQDHYQLMIFFLHHQYPKIS
jgi:hypothetical protein